jgi:hypothetical protein
MTRGQIFCLQVGDVIASEKGDRDLIIKIDFNKYRSDDYDSGVYCLFTDGPEFGPDFGMINGNYLRNPKVSKL